jgi:hypothetical protein
MDDLTVFQVENRDDAHRFGLSLTNTFGISTRFMKA